MSSGGFDISSLTRNSPAGGSATPPAFAGLGGHQPLLPNIGAPMMAAAAAGHHGHHPAAAMAANNALASSVNLSSIQSLVDPLQELPLPNETVQAARDRQRLIDDTKHQYHTVHNQDLGIQHQLSHQLIQALVAGRQQTLTAQINWNANVAPRAPGQQQYVQPTFSEMHKQNSYLLSLLQQKDGFGAHAQLPPVTHQGPPPQQRPQQHPAQVQNQYWSPWEQQQGQQPATQQPVQQQVPSPFVASPAPAVGPSPQHQQQQGYPTPRPHSGGYANHANNQMYAQLNDNSNSNSSSFTDQTAASMAPNTPGGHAASPMAGHQQNHQQSYQAQQQVRYDQRQQMHHTASPHQSFSQSHQQPQHPNAHHHLQQQQPQEQFTPPTHQQPPQQQLQQQSPAQDTKPYANASMLTKEPVIAVEKLDLDAYYSSFGSLGDRVKSNKRQRVPDATTPPKKEKQSSSTTSSASKDNNSSSSKNRQSRDSSFSSPAKKAAKITNAVSYQKSSASSFSTSYTSSHSLTSSSAPQLMSQTSSLPAFDKFEAMLDEMFNMGGKSKADKKKKQRGSSDDEQSDSDGDRKHKKKPSNKVNGESADGESVSQLFDITISGATLAHFVALTAKLKRNDQMQTVPASKLINLLTVLTQQLAVQSAYLKDKRRRSTEDREEEEDEEETNITNSASMMQKFESCCDCACIALYVLSSKGMSSRVYLEECIEQTIAFLNTTIQQYTTIGASTYASTSPSKNKKSPKKANNYISPTVGANKKILAKMYTKWSELIGLLVEMLTLRQGSLTDTLVLASTRLALGAFFLESLSPGGSSSMVSSGGQSNEIQLNALRLTTTIFSQYQGHRAVILDELLQSIARLPTTKRNRVMYKVDSDDGSSAISMFSALLQQLIQSLFIPSPKPKTDDKAAESKQDKKDEKVALLQTLKSQYEAALRVAYTFLQSFIRKCCGISVGGAQAATSDCDYRVLFENLVADLMITLHKPNWPAAQLLTQILIKILVTNITSTVKLPKGSGGGGQAQLNLKLASLDHLGTIVSRFAKEISEVDKIKGDVKSSLNRILNGDKEDRGDDEANEDPDSPVEVKKKKAKRKQRKGSKDTRTADELDSDEKMEKEIWKHLIRYCDEEKLIEEKNLFVSMWLKEKERQAEIAQQHNQDNEQNGAVGPSPMEQFETNAKRFLTIYRTAANPNSEPEEYHVIDSKTAESIIRFLDISQTTTVKQFDSALGHLVAALSATSNTTMRSRAMKSLSTILNNADKQSASNLLSRTDLQIAIKNALLDASTSVREATIDLIGKFILNSDTEELIDKYYDIITDRLLDTGVSVRKRVIKILRQICETFPSYSRIPEICSRIIKRINDDGEGIRKQVTETFSSMWFKEERDKVSIRLKVQCIMHVVSTVVKEKIGTEWLQQLLSNLFTKDGDKKKTADEDDDDKPSLSAQQLQQVTNASTQIIDVLVSDILCCDQQSADQQNKQLLLSAMTTLWLFAKVQPQLVIHHVNTLHPFLSMKCMTQGDLMIMIKVIQILELVVPKLSNPSPSTLTRIEEDLTKNILQGSMQMLQSCISCLSSLIHKHTNNRKLAQDLFLRFFRLLEQIVQNNLHTNTQYRPRLLRSLFTCGLFAKHFEFLQEKQQLYEIYMRFIRESQAADGQSDARDQEILSKSLTALGFMFERNPAFVLEREAMQTYMAMLKYNKHHSLMYQEITTVQVLKNLTNYFSDEFNAEMERTVEWSKENLKSMASEDGDNSLQSRIIQCYLNDVLQCTLSPVLIVRRAAVNLIHIIHNSGLGHPIQLVPYLIAMSSDDDATIRNRADHVLNEIERKYHGFVTMKSKQGVQLSHMLHFDQGRRGYRVENTIQSTTANSTTASSLGAEDKMITGRLATLYRVVAANRQGRRAFMGSLLKHFDLFAGPSTGMVNDTMSMCILEGSNYSGDLGPLQSFVCDNLVWLPYSFWDEPLYILQQLELNISLLASHISSQFKDILNIQGDEDEVVEEALNQKEAGNGDGPAAKSHSGDDPVKNKNEAGTNSFTADLRSYIPKPMPSLLATSELVKNLKAFYMLTWTKQLLRELFSITDQKIQDYSPNENQKVWDKPVHRRNVDVRILDTLMTYPTINIDLERPDDKLRTRLLEEYQRFNNHQLTGFDANSKTVVQILKEPPPKPGKEKSNANHKQQQRDDDEYLPPTLNFERDAIPELSREAEEELMLKIRNNDCAVALQDISTLDIQSLIKQSGSESHNKPEVHHQQPAPEPPQQPSLKIKLPLNIGAESSSRRKKSKKEKKKKKKKKHRMRIESDDEESNESDSPDDSDDDPSYN